jgi:hypothetical protein
MACLKDRWEQSSFRIWPGTASWEQDGIEQIPQLLLNRLDGNIEDNLINSSANMSVPVGWCV